MKVGATKRQCDGSDKKEIRKKRLALKYNYSSGQMKQKYKLLLLKMAV